MSEIEAHPNEGQEFKYWAFISYSHDDESWAKWLHTSLETYAVPRKLAGRKTSKHGELPRRIFPVFRDRDDLPGAADLSGKITTALSKSRNLIVICSPSSATSKWVNEEIRTYKAMGRDDRVLCLIIDGEPNAADQPQSGLEECFPEAVRFRVDQSGRISQERAEPIAADVRQGKDGRANAKVKLLAGILDVGYDELRQRERRRKFQRRLRLLAVGVVLVLLIVMGYLAIADAGLAIPGRNAIQTSLDRHDISVFRHAHSNAEIRAKATSLRRNLIDALEKGRNSNGWIVTNLNPKQDAGFEVWSHSQSLCGIFKTPEVENRELRPFVNALNLPFDSGLAIEDKGIKYGWTHPGDSDTIAEPALWTAAALAAAVARPGLLTPDERRRVERQLSYTQEVLKRYRPLDSDGWNMFANQKQPALHNPYTTTVALLTLLEMRKAGLPWEGSIERRDQLLRSTAQWLIDNFDDEGPAPGWHGIAESANEIFDGLTLQIYSELLRAEAEAGVKLPPRILQEIPLHLARCVERDLDFPVGSGEFSAAMNDHSGRETVGKESVGFLWYPWAIEAAERWLDRADKRGASAEDRVRVRRALGHLVVDLGDDAVNKARRDWTFIVAELLYGLSNVRVPNS